MQKCTSGAAICFLQDFSKIDSNKHIKTLSPLYFPLLLRKKGTKAHVFCVCDTAQQIVIHAGRRNIDLSYSARKS